MVTGDEHEGNKCAKERKTGTNENNHTETLSSRVLLRCSIVGKNSVEDNSTNSGTSLSDRCGQTDKMASESSWEALTADKQRCNTWPKFTAAEHYSVKNNDITV